MQGKNGLVRKGFLANFEETQQIFLKGFVARAATKTAEYESQFKRVFLRFLGSKRYVSHFAQNAWNLRKDVLSH